MRILIPLILLISLNAFGVCEKNLDSPTGFSAKAPFGEAVSTKLVRCQLSVEVTLPNPETNETYVLGDHFISKKRIARNGKIKATLDHKNFDANQRPKFGEKRNRPALAEADITLSADNITTDPEDRSNLAPVFLQENLKHLKLNNIALNQNLYAQTYVFCDKNGTEQSRIQLVSMNLKFSMNPGRGNNPPHIYVSPDKKSLENTGSVISSEVSYTPSNDEILVYHQNSPLTRNRHGVLYCRDLPINGTEDGPGKSIQPTET